MSKKLEIRSIGQLCINTLPNVPPCQQQSEQVSDTSEKTPYFVPTYQRGYRWTTLQVHQLVDDLWKFYKENKETDRWYCLQPLVVKINSDENKIVVIDGQQRLTTIYILLQLLGKNDNLFSLEYDSRKSTEIVLKNTDSEDKSTPDNYHIFYARKTIRQYIRQYIESKQQMEMDAFSKEAFSEWIMKNVKVIWYETKNDDYTEFLNLNTGKISLSNAELIKALLLSLLEKEQGDVYVQEASHEWDAIEQTLQDNDFWCFANPDANAERFSATRIDFLFEMILRIDKAALPVKDTSKSRYKYLKELDKDKEKRLYFKNTESIEEESKLNPYFIFFVFQEFCNPRLDNVPVTKDPATFIWEDVRTIFRTIQNWFDDLNFYHRIGFLMNSFGSRNKFETLVELLQKSQQMTEDDFLKLLTDKLKSFKPGDINDLSYDKKSDHDQIKNILLLFNIGILMRQTHEKSRYPFRMHKDMHKDGDWTLEHIHAKKQREIQKTDIKTIARLLQIKTKGKGNDDIVSEMNSRFSEGYMASKSKDDSQDKDDTCSCPYCMAAKNAPDNSKNPPVPSSVPDQEPEDLKHPLIIITKDENKDEYKLVDQKNINGIENMALLGHRDNSIFNNGIYLEKRAILIEWEKEIDKQGEEETGLRQTRHFVPLATKMVFFKQFSDVIDCPFLWTANDGEKYIKAIQDVLENVLNLS